MWVPGGEEVAALLGLLASVAIDEDPHSFLTHKGAVREVSQCLRRMQKTLAAKLKLDWVPCSSGKHSPVFRLPIYRGFWELSAKLHLRPRWEFKGLRKLSGDLAGATPGSAGD